MNNDIAQRLAEMRRSRGYSQEELAWKLGLSRQAISKWERAESSPDTGNLLALSRLYGVTLDELVCGSDADTERHSVEESTAVVVPAETPAPEPVGTPVPIAMPAETVSEPVPATTPVSAPASVVTEPAPTVAPEPVATPAAMPTAAPTVGAAPTVAPTPAAAPTVGAAPTVAPTPIKRSAWSTFPYPVACALAYLVIGFCFGWWHPAWIIFFTIPFYYWLVKTIHDDPIYRQNHQQ